MSTFFPQPARRVADWLGQHGGSTVWRCPMVFADRAAIGCDQFVYWDPTDPKACLAPDAFVRWGEPDSLFQSWKAWERGAPHVAVEIISESDARDRDWESALSRYRRLGVRELVRFDPASLDRPLRVWGAGGSARPTASSRAGPSQRLRRLDWQPARQIGPVIRVLSIFQVQTRSPSSAQSLKSIVKVSFEPGSSVRAIPP
jgi:hypothetical protein